jgi:threonine/homoserine/homoserine lactone efflux protein
VDIWTLVAFTIAYAIAVIVPGPGVAAVVARALGGGFSNAVPMIGGILAGDLAYFTFAIFGLAALAAWFEPVLIIVRWAGAFYLLYVAWRFWTARPGSEQMKPRREDPWKTFLSGFSLTLGNPKTIVFFVSLLPTVIPLGGLSPLAILQLTGIVVVVLIGVCSSYALLASAAREFFRSPVALGRLNKTAGLMMATAAGFVLFQH